MTPADFREALATLTPRELETLQEVVKGETNWQIGQRLGGISARAVAYHITEILWKLEARNRTHAAAMMVAWGEPEPEAQ